MDPIEKNQIPVTNTATTNAMAESTENNEALPTMNTLTERVNKAIQNGYVENFKMTPEGLASDKTHITYHPDQVSIIDFYRFEGESDPADSAIMYVIDTNDGLKGTLIDSYGAYADENINKFVAEVHGINKK